MPKLTITETALTVEREAGDPKFYGVRNAAGESRFLHWVMGILNKSHGYDLIKKRMWKDGHLVSDMQQYLRTRSPKSDFPKVAFWNTHWQINGLDEDFNRGEAVLRIETDIF